MSVRVGVSFDGFVPTADAVTLAQQAVAAGARSLWMAEHLGYREAIATCMAFAIKAPGPLLVPTAVSPYLWHAMPTAMALATLDEMAPGCAAIAVGTGNPLFLTESGRAIEKPVRAARDWPSNRAHQFRSTSPPLGPTCFAWPAASGMAWSSRRDCRRIQYGNRSRSVARAPERTGAI
jgi:hypothetical protein